MTKLAIKEDSARLALFSFLVFLLCYSAIITSDFYYQDDKTRQLWGGLNWDSVARPAADWVMHLFTFNGHIVDVAPLTQICALLMMAALALPVKRALDIKCSIDAFLVIGVLFMHPFYLQNMSYKFDSFTMTLGVTLATLSAIVIKRVKHGICIPLASFLLLLSISLYQASINVAIIFSAAFIILLIISKEYKEAGYYAVRFSISIILSVLSFMLYTRHMIEMSAYAEKSSALLSFDNLTQGLVNNFSYFAGFTIEITPIYSAIILGLLSTALMALGIELGYKKRNFTCLFIVYALIAGAGIFSFGMLLLLDSPLRTPRVMIGLGAFASLLFYASIVTGIRALTAVSRFFATLAIFYTITVSLAYGNSLKLLKSFEDSYFVMVMEDVINVAEDQGKSRLAILGSSPIPNSVNVAMREIPIIHELISPSANPGWPGRNTSHWYGSNLTYDQNRFVSTNVCDSLPVIQRGSYAVRVIGEHVILDFQMSC